MYAAATHRLGKVLELEFLQGLPVLFLYAAMVAWVVALAGLAHDVFGRSLSRWR